MIRNAIRVVATCIAITLAGSIAYGLIGSASADEQAVGNVQIIRVEYNVPGADTPANAYRESVQIKNLTGAPVPMAGWTLEDLTGHEYEFPATYTLGIGETVNVRTGHTPTTDAGSWWNGHSNLYWGRNHMYGNAADSVTLLNAGNRVDRVAWNDFTIRP